MFYAADVSRWLIDTGRAVPVAMAGSRNCGSSRIARTQAECAAHFRVSSRAVGYWLTTPGFPGRAGAPGTQTGYFPLEEIQQWLASRGTEHSGELAELRLQRLKARTAREALRLAKMQASLAPRGQLLDAARHLASKAAPVLDNLVDAMMRDAPKLPVADRKRLRSVLRGRIGETKRVLAEAAVGDGDESDS